MGSNYAVFFLGQFCNSSTSHRYGVGFKIAMNHTCRQLREHIRNNHALTAKRINRGREKTLEQERLRTVLALNVPFLILPDTFVFLMLSGPAMGGPLQPEYFYS